MCKRLCTGGIPLLKHLLQHLPRLREALEPLLHSFESQHLKLLGGEPGLPEDAPESPHGYFPVRGDDDHAKAIRLPSGELHEACLGCAGGVAVVLATRRGF
jgi:hypothetical protein